MSPGVCRAIAAIARHIMKTTAASLLILHFPSTSTGTRDTPFARRPTLRRQECDTGRRTHEGTDFRPADSVEPFLSDARSPRPARRDTATFARSAGAGQDR